MARTSPLAGIVLLAFLIPATVVAGDPVTAAPDNYTVLLENDEVRVLRFQDQPGDRIAMHSHPDYLVYFLAPMHRRFGFADGRTVDVEAPAGEARWLNSVTHSEENIGTEAADVLIVEFKRGSSN